MRTGDHILTLRSDTWAGWRGTCSCGEWSVQDQNKSVVRTEHSAHFDDANEREQAEREAQS